MTYGVTEEIADAAVSSCGKVGVMRNIEKFVDGYRGMSYNNPASLNLTRWPSMYSTDIVVPTSAVTTNENQ